MRARFLFLAAGLLTAAAIGCGSSPANPLPGGGVDRRPAIPDAGDVTEVRIEPQVSLKQGYWPENRLTDAGPIGEVIAWLNGIDWSKQPTDIRRADLPPLSQLILTRRDKATQKFGLIDRGIIATPWLWTADTDRLKMIFKKAAAP
jgi:hypothetical protein